MARNETKRFEYKLVPAPRKGLKARGAKTPEARFAAALMEIMNEMGREGWEYQRADTLPCDQRSGLTGKTTVYHNVLVFRRVIAAPQEEAPAEDAPIPPAADRVASERKPEREAVKTRAPESRAPGKASDAATASRRRLGSALGDEPGSENGESPKLGPAREESAPEN